MHSLLPARTGSLTVLHAKSRVGLAVGTLAMVTGAFGASAMPTVAAEAVRPAPMALSWSATDLDPAEFGAVACTTPTHCIALGPEGWAAWSDDGGQRWTSSVVASLENATFKRVVCPSASRCVAVGAIDEIPLSSGIAPGAAAVSLDGGLHWVRARIPGSLVDFLGGLACPTTKVCYATAVGLPSGDRGFFLESTDGGLSWNARLAWPEPELYRAGALSCPEVGHCWATGGRYGIVVTTNGGHSWMIQHEPMGAQGLPDLADLDCQSVLRCIGVGVSGMVLAIVVTDDGGASWRFPPNEASSRSSLWTAGPGVFASVSCSTAGRCVAVGGEDIKGPIVAVSNDWGESWQEPATPSPTSGGGLFDVTCDALNSCIIVGSTANEAALIATSAPNAPWTTRFQGVGSTWTSLSCPGLKHCVAVGSSSGPDGYPSGAEVLTSTNGGLNWMQQRPPARVFALSGVDCPSVGICYATAYVSPSSSLEGTPWMAALYRSDDGGRTWHRESLPKILILAAITCPSSSICYAVGAIDANGSPSHDAIVKTVDGGAHWVDQPVPTPVHAEGLYAISCPSALRCWAVGDYGVLATKNGGRTWWDQPVDSGLQAIACPAEQMCVAVSDGYGFGPSLAPSLYVTLDGGRTWSSPSLPAASLGLTGVSCPTTSECVAAGSGPKGAVVLASFDGGRRWALQPVPQMANSIPGESPAYDTVQCAAPLHCVVLGGGPIAELAIGS
jgi:photosystem II stability/assembly factor-like uncharacterized protein